MIEDGVGVLFADARRCVDAPLEHSGQEPGLIGAAHGRQQHRLFSGHVGARIALEGEIPLGLATRPDRRTYDLTLQVWREHSVEKIKS